MIELSAIDLAIVAAYLAVVIGRGPWAGRALFVLMAGFIAAFW